MKIAVFLKVSLLQRDLSRLMHLVSRCSIWKVEILYLLASHPGRVFDREQILSKVWGYDYFGDTRAVDTQIKRIRQKMPEDCKWGIRTVYGVGYKFGMTE